MIRDFNLIRNILLEAETTPAGKIISSFNFNGVDQYTIAEHIENMIESGLLDGQVIHNFGGPPAYIVRRITWQGHDFLANAKNDTIWKKVMAEAKEKGTSMTMVVINGLLTKAAQKYAGLE